MSGGHGEVGKAVNSGNWPLEATVSLLGAALARTPARPRPVHRRTQGSRRWRLASLLRSASPATGPGRKGAAIWPGRDGPGRGPRQSALGWTLRLLGHGGGQRAELPTPPPRGHSFLGWGPA